LSREESGNIKKAKKSIKRYISSVLLVLLSQLWFVIYSSRILFRSKNQNMGGREIFLNAGVKSVS